MSHTGFFITFEGSEGCGKSTQIRLLAEHLHSIGHDTLLLREPGGTPSGEAIRHLLQHAPEGEALVPEAELLLFAASRAQLVSEVIQPAIAAGRIVISDRFMDSTTVYQGVARRIDTAQTALINSFAVGSTLPDVTFVLDLDRITARKRMGESRDSLDRIERESEDFFEAVRQGYLRLAKENPDRIFLIDASRPVDSVAREILDAITARMPGLATC